MLNAEHGPGHHSVPMVHEGDVVGVVMAQIREVVAELLAFGEELLKAADAAVQGVTPGVDNLGVRQHGFD